GIRDKLVTGVQTCALPISPTAPKLKDLSAEIGGSDESIPEYRTNSVLCCHSLECSLGVASCLLFRPNPHEQSVLEHRWIGGEKQNHAVHRRNNSLEGVAEQISDRSNLLPFLHEITRPDVRIPHSFALRVEPLKSRQNCCSHGAVRCLLRLRF